MKAKNLCVGAVALAMISMAMFAGVSSAKTVDEWHGHGDRPIDPGTYYLNQDVMFGEKVVKDGKNYGIYMDGSLVSLDDQYYNPDTSSYWDMSWQSTVSTQADWSDDLVLHEWDFGDKIRTEVILQCLDDTAVSVYTVSASFLIEFMDDGAWTEVWYGTTLEGLWADGPVDAYSAEVNQVGNLLYGYNWDTKSMVDAGPGQYKLTFTLLDVSIVLPDYKEYTDDTTYVAYLIEHSDITISENVDETLNPVNFLDGIGHSTYSTWIEITLN